MYTYHHLFYNRWGFKINAIIKCGNAGCLLFDWQCEKINRCEFEYKVQVVS